MNNFHPTQAVVVGTAKVQIDVDVVEMIKVLVELGAKPKLSCQNLGEYLHRLADEQNSRNRFDLAGHFRRQAMYCAGSAMLVLPNEDARIFGTWMASAHDSLFTERVQNPDILNGWEVRIPYQSVYGEMVPSRNTQILFPVGDIDIITERLKAFRDEGNTFRGIRELVEGD